MECKLGSLKGKKKYKGVEDGENARNVVPRGLCARQSDLKMERGCVFMEGRG